MLGIVQKGYRLVYVCDCFLEFPVDQNGRNYEKINIFHRKLLLLCHTDSKQMAKSGKQSEVSCGTSGLSGSKENLPMLSSRFLAHSRSRIKLNITVV